MRKTNPKQDRVGDLLVSLDYLNSCLKEEPNGCVMPYRGGRHKQGYLMLGAFRLTDGKYIMTTAHRVVARLKLKREISSDEFVIATCSRMGCCNPNHLIVGDRQDIHKIMKKNHRYAGSYASGREIKQQKRNYKYSIPDMIYMRNHTFEEIALKFNITRNEASKRKNRISRGYLWLNDYNEDGTRKGE